MINFSSHDVFRGVPKVIMERMGSMLYIQQPSSLHHLSELRTQAARGLMSAPAVQQVSRALRIRGLCYIPVIKKKKPKGQEKGWNVFKCHKQVHSRRQTQGHVFCGSLGPFWTPRLALVHPPLPLTFQKGCTMNRLYWEPAVPSRVT